MSRDDWTSEGDEWTTDGKRIDEHVLQWLRDTVENVSAVIIEHRFYRGSRAPHRFVSDDIEELETYLKTKVRAGDWFHFWRYADCCREDNFVETGKIPDAQGRVPKRGPY